MSQIGSKLAVVMVGEEGTIRHVLMNCVIKIIEAGIIEGDNDSNLHTNNHPHRPQVCPFTHIHMHNHKYPSVLLLFIIFIEVFDEKYNSVDLSIANKYLRNKFIKLVLTYW